MPQNSHRHSQPVHCGCRDCPPENRQDRLSGSRSDVAEQETTDPPEVGPAHGRRRGDRSCRHPERLRRSGYNWHHGHDGSGDNRTSTPIKHVVVLFDENVSYDHYFGTYPKAADNGQGTPFTAKRNTPKANGLTPALLTANPNQYNPQRLSPSQALTCDQNHGYTAEQKASDNGKNDQYVQNTNVSTCTGQPILYGAPGLVMDYYDGNTVTGLWNYAQNYAMSDNAYSDVFGPSTPGALNLISGQTYGASAVNSTTGQPVIGLVHRRPERRRRRHAVHRRGPGVRRLLGQRPRLDLAAGRAVRHQRRRPAEQEERDLGLVPGRLRADHRRRHLGQRLRAVRRHQQEHRRQLLRRLLARTTTRSSTTSRRRTRTTCRRRSRR